jgi:hypothetical protein
VTEEFRSPLLAKLLSAASTYYNNEETPEHVLYECMTSNRVPFDTIVQDFYKKDEASFMGRYREDFRCQDPHDAYSRARKMWSARLKAKEVLEDFDKYFEERPESTPPRIPDYLVDHDTFDVLVECGYVSEATAKIITDRGFYGEPMSETNLKALREGQRCTRMVYGLIYDGVDGRDTEEYSTKEELIERVRSRCPGTHWRPAGFIDDYSAYSLVGCTMEEAGVACVDGFCEVLDE